MTERDERPTLVLIIIAAMVLGFLAFSVAWFNIGTALTNNSQRIEENTKDIIILREDLRKSHNTFIELEKKSAKRQEILIDSEIKSVERQKEILKLLKK